MIGCRQTFYLCESNFIEVDPFFQNLLNSNKTDIPMKFELERFDCFAETPTAMGKLHDLIIIKLKRDFKDIFNSLGMWYEFEYLRWWCYIVCCTHRMRQTTVPRQRSHQLWPTKHCRVVRKYWAQTRNWLVRSLAPRDFLQCSACDCVGGVRLGTESLVICDSVQTLCAVLDRDHVTLHFLSTRPWPPVGST